MLKNKNNTFFNKKGYSFKQITFIVLAKLKVALEIFNWSFAKQAVKNELLYIRMSLDLFSKPFQLLESILSSF